MLDALARRLGLLPCLALLLLAVPTTASADILKGTPRSDRLTGTAGSDTLRARAGNDVIRADGRDRVAAGRGRDRVRLVADALAYSVDCGRGRDRLTIVASPQIARSSLKRRVRRCETVDIVGPPVSSETDVFGGLSIPSVLKRVDRKPPTTPQNLTTTGRTDTTIGVAWTASTDNVGVTGYRIYRNGARVATVTSTSFTLTGLGCGTAYEIGVTAIDAAGNESSRALRQDSTTACPTADTQAPSVPQGFTTTGRTDSTISVAWNASTDNVGVTGYRVYRNGAVIATVSSTSYTLTGLACGTSYEISLTAIDAAGNESHRPEAVRQESTTACAAADTQAPSVPQGFTTTDRTATTISVAWNASTDNVGVTGYRIYRNGTRIATVTSTKYTLTDLTCGTSYEIGLTAIDAAGNESYRPEAIKHESTTACEQPSSQPAPTTSEPATTSPANLFVAPNGSDSASCTASAPCRSFARAYSVAPSGSVIEVAAGSFGPQSVPGGSKTITFRGVPGNKVLQLKSDADNITFEGLDLDAGGTKTTGAVFEHGGAFNVTLRNSRVGNVVDEKGAMLGGSSSTSPTNLVIDNVDFHDVLYRTPGTHNECIMAHAPGITIRNSTFRNCATMDISLGRGDWWGQPPYGNVVLENNVFGHSTNGDGWHYFGLAWFVGKFENARVVNNTFENAVRMETQHIGPGPYSGVWANNIGGGWQCLPGVVYRGNVGKKCDASDREVNPSSSCGPPACPSLRTMPVGWIDPGAFNFRLQAGSIAVDAGSATYAPATDRDGKGRNGAPDAGAHELDGTSGAQPRTAESPSAEGPTAGTASPAVASARLAPRTICRAPRSGCPRSSRLRVQVAGGAVRVRVRVRRAGRKRVVRSFAIVPRHGRAKRLRARGLARGRYRVTLVARDAAGTRSAPRTLRLRVR